MLLKEVSELIAAAEAEDAPFHVTGKATLRGWQRHWDKSRKEYFYSDVITGETTWKAPHDAWRRQNRKEKFCDPVGDEQQDEKNDGPAISKHDKCVLFENRFDIGHENDLTHGKSESPGDCCRVCELEKLCLGFMHSGGVCYLKKAGAEVDAKIEIASMLVKTIGIRIKAGSLAEELDHRSELVAKMESGAFVLY